MRRKIIVCFVFIFILHQVRVCGQLNDSLNIRIALLAGTIDKQEKLRILIRICEQTINDTIAFAGYSATTLALAKELNDACSLFNFSDQGSLGRRI